jgi:hypothetical protein
VLRFLGGMDVGAVSSSLVYLGCIYFSKVLNPLRRLDGRLLLISRVVFYFAFTPWWARMVHWRILYEYFEARHIASKDCNLNSNWIS